MFVELIEALRCPRDHAESPLVVTASRTDARHIMDGWLGCPVCHAEFQIRNGEALFTTDAMPVERVFRMAPGADRQRERSRFFPGMAEAMADQWGAATMRELAA